MAIQYSMLRHYFLTPIETDFPVPNYLHYDSRNTIPEVVKQQRFAKTESSTVAQR
ncbi:MAG: hypothetical protein P8M20_03205 [Planctomycetaceae bacterium]|nr:hypothetical protein [Planctomycetaceae bacterium]